MGISYIWLRVNLKSHLPHLLGSCQVQVTPGGRWEEKWKRTVTVQGLSRLPDKQTSCLITVPFLLPVAYHSRHRA